MWSQGPQLLLTHTNWAHSMSPYRTYDVLGLCGLSKLHRYFPQAEDLDERKIFFGLTRQAFIILRSFWLLKSLLLRISQVAFCLMLLNIVHYHAPLKCFLCKQQRVAESFWQQCHCGLLPPPVLTVSWQGCQSVWLWYSQRKENLKGVVVACCLGGCFKRPNDIEYIYLGLLSQLTYNERMDATVHLLHVSQLVLLLCKETNHNK